MRLDRGVPGRAGEEDRPTERDGGATPPWGTIFGLRHASLGLLALSSLLVPQLGDGRFTLAVLLAGVALPADVLVHIRARRRHRLPRALPYLDQIALAGAAVLFPGAHIPLALLAVTDLGVMTLLAGRRSAAGALVCGVQTFALGALAVGAAEALVSALGYLVAAPALVATVGADRTGSSWLPRDRGHREPPERLRPPQTTGRRTTALLLVSVDDLPQASAVLGEDAGLGETILGRLERTFGAEATIERYGGDRFVALLRGVDPREGAEAAGRAADALADPVVVGDMAVRLGARVGLALAGTEETDIATLLDRAKVSLAVSASRRPRPWALSTVDSTEEADGDSVTELRRAIDRGELVLHYQPKLDVHLGRIVGVEALVRWEHPTRGLLGPGEFVPLAERSGLIGDLTAEVLDAAISQARTWEEQGLDLDVAVNVSVRDLEDGRLQAGLARLLAEHGVAGRRLTLEITEDRIMDDPARAVEVLHGLASLGVRLSVDDFGTGHSSLAYLKRLPLDEIKIDRAFISEILEGSPDAMIVGSLVELSHKLGLDVVAEGLEDADALERVTELTRCDLVQGFGIARPMVPDHLEGWLRGCRWGAGDDAFAASG